MPGGLDSCSPRATDGGFKAAAAGTGNTGMDASTATARRLAQADCDDAANSGGVKIACLGDINRAGHQLQRGGGAVCFTKNTPLWEAFLGIVAEVGDCGAL